MRRLVILLALLTLALIPAATAGSAPSQGYIVVLESSANPAAVATEHARQLGLQVGFVYSNALKGYSALVPAGALDDLNADSRVAYVERDCDQARQHNADRRHVGPRPDRPARSAAVHDLHLHRDRRGRDGLRDRHRHPEDPHAVRRPRGHGADTTTPVGVTSDDCHGHGTHVAGTIGGSTHGVAKSVRLVAVRVLDCAGTGSTPA